MWIVSHLYRSVVALHFMSRTGVSENPLAVLETALPFLTTKMRKFLNDAYADSQRGIASAIF